jgi:hypothetical protein
MAGYPNFALSDVCIVDDEDHSILLVQVNCSSHYVARDAEPPPLVAAAIAVFDERNKILPRFFLPYYYSLQSSYAVANIS